MSSCVQIKLWHTVELAAMPLDYLCYIDEAMQAGVTNSWSTQPGADCRLHLRCKITSTADAP